MYDKERFMESKTDDDLLDISLDKKPAKQQDNNIIQDENKDDDICVGIMDKYVGNVLNDTDVFFEYGIDKNNICKYKGGLDRFRFQVQIEYNKMDGSKMLRVITQEIETTYDREKVINGLDMNVLNKYGKNVSVKLSQIGDYEASRVWMNANARYMHRLSVNNNNNMEQEPELMATTCLNDETIV
eukprot:33162_1